MQKSMDVKSKISPPDDFDGPTKNRRCTDLLWSIILIACWFGTGVIGHYALEYGDLDRISHPVDYNGRPCGVGSMINKPDLYFLRADGTGVCVESCPNQTNINVTYACVDEADMKNATDSSDLINNFVGFCMWQMSTYNDNDFCVVNDEKYAKGFPSSAGILTSDGSSTNDIWRSRNYIIGFGLSAAVIFYIYVVFLHCGKTVGAMVWAAIWMVFIALFLIGASWLATARIESGSLSAGYDWSDLSRTATISFVAGIIAILLAFLWLSWTLALRSSIRLASGLIKEAATTIIAMPSLLLLPVFQVIVWCCFFAVWAIIVLYVSTTGDYEQKTIDGDPLPRMVFTPEPSAGCELAFLGFILLWTSLFLTGFTDLIISYGTAHWYFNRDKSQRTCNVVQRSFCTIFCYHFGTAAVGSLLVTIVYPFRAILTWIDRQMGKCCGGRGCNQAIYCCFCCCLFLVQHFFRYWTKYAYAFTALFSQSFAMAGKASFFLLERNLNKVSVVAIITEYIMMMLILFVTFTATVASYYCIKLNLDDELEDLVVPTAVTFALALLISVLCVEVLGMTTRTIVICFLADLEMFSPEDRYVEASLLKYMDTAIAAPGSPSGSDTGLRLKKLDPIPENETARLMPPAETGTEDPEYGATAR